MNKVIIIITLVSVIQQALCKQLMQFHLILVSFALFAGRSLKTKDKTTMLEGNPPRLHVGHVGIL